MTPPHTWSAKPSNGTDVVLTEKLIRKYIDQIKHSAQRARAVKAARIRNGDCPHDAIEACFNTDGSWEMCCRDCRLSGYSLRLAIGMGDE